jgi:pyruvate dehydrogenase E1 component
LNPEGERRVPYVTSLLEGRQGPAIVATDYVRAYPEQVRAFVPMRYTVLGTDGYGRSDTRENLRRHFEVNRYYVAQAAVAALVGEGRLVGEDAARAASLYGIEGAKPNPLGV